MKKALLLLLTLCCLLLIANSVNAIPLNYTMMTNLTTVNGAVDPLGLDGGILKVNFTLDSNTVPDVATTPGFDDYNFGLYDNVIADLSLTQSDGTIVYNGSVVGVTEVVDYFGADINKSDALAWHIDSADISGIPYDINVYTKFDKTLINWIDLFSFTNTDVTDVLVSFIESESPLRSLYSDELPHFASGTPNAPVPEPATMLLFGTGLAGLAGYRKRKLMKK